jgi:hypothetical protein
MMETGLKMLTHITSPHWLFMTPSCAKPQCYGLKMKCRPQAHVLKGWSPAGGAILGNGGNFRRCDLTGGIRSLVEERILSLAPSSVSLCFLATVR